MLGQSNVDLLYNDGFGVRYNSLPASLKGGLIGYWNLNEEDDGNGIDSHGSNDLVAVNGATHRAGPPTPGYVSRSSKNLATTSLKPTLHLGSRNEYISTGREQAL